jgi:hypothetical protein
MEKQVKAIGSEIETVVDGDALLKKRLSYVLSITGAGLPTAVTVVSETDGFAAVSNIKQRSVHSPQIEQGNSRRLDTG